MTLEGRIDALTIREQFWLVLIAGKRGDFNVLQAVPQALAYMSALTQFPVFGLATNGLDYVFIKLEGKKFALSHNFTLLADAEHNLLRVAQLLKHLVGPSFR
ncbi:MAG: hypothetical protein NZL92_05820 [Gloeomargarita sp. SKYG116]|nr:hypothetical protein [Gloeomargarita sp. SKYG116]MDW8401195.1 hypothetical protein [Gloeomargarita sp. SKYGB_i_bin116]